MIIRFTKLDTIDKALLSLLSIFIITLLVFTTTNSNMAAVIGFVAFLVLMAIIVISSWINLLNSKRTTDNKVLWAIFFIITGFWGCVIYYLGYKR